MKTKFTQLPPQISNQCQNNPKCNPTANSNRRCTFQCNWIKLSIKDHHAYFLFPAHSSIFVILNVSPLCSPMYSLIVTCTILHFQLQIPFYRLQHTCSDFVVYSISTIWQQFKEIHLHSFQLKCANVVRNRNEKVDQLCL